MFCLRKAFTLMFLKSGITAIRRRPDTFPCFSPATMTRPAFRSSVDGYPASPPEHTRPRCRESKYLGTAPQQPADEAGHKTQDNKQPWICAQHLTPFSAIRRLKSLEPSPATDRKAKLACPQLSPLLFESGESCRRFVPQVPSGLLFGFWVTALEGGFWCGHSLTQRANIYDDLRFVCCASKLPEL